MFKYIAPILVAIAACTPASAGLTVSDQLEAVFQNNVFTATTSAQVDSTNTTDNDGSFVNLIAVNDIVEMVFAFSGTKNGDTDYAAVLFRATGSTDVAASRGGFSGTVGQETSFSTQEGFDYSAPSFLATTESIFSTGSNNVAYLVTSDTFDFTNKTFAQIDGNSAVNVVASYALDTGSTFSMDALGTGFNSINSNGSGTVEVTYDLKLTQTAILAAHSSDFSTVDGTNAAIATSSALAGKLFTTTFNSSDTIHNFTNSNNQLEFNTVFAVPEPSSLAVVGCLLIGGLRSRRRRS